MQKKEYFRMHAELCRAISHAKRLEILSHLRDGELSVGELAERMEVAPANVSQQLTVLRNRGVVDRRKEGTTAYYFITNPKILKAYDLMTEVMEEHLSKGAKVLRRMPGRKSR